MNHCGIQGNSETKTFVPLSRPEANSLACLLLKTSLFLELFVSDDMTGNNILLCTEVMLGDKSTH